MALNAGRETPEVTEGILTLSSGWEGCQPPDLAQGCCVVGSHGWHWPLQGEGHLGKHFGVIQGSRATESE